MLSEVEVREDDIIGSLDVVGMFPNIPVKKTLDVAIVIIKEELQNYKTLTGKWRTFQSYWKYQSRRILKQ